ncbi:MAG: carotenoid biosynthesis protein [Acidimicrobiia bacterium]|nr:carotenoid biosynthesis protein [Acidimicrobiia bacterium]
MSVLEQTWGTFGGRWFVTLFAVAYVLLGWRVLGPRRLGMYTLVAFPLAVLVENASVHWGIPFTRYSFNAALRGREIWIGEVPLFVPFSYMFVMFFAWAAGRFVVTGPWLTAPRSRLVAYLVGVLFATWATWSLDPVTQIGRLWYIGETFRYDGPGFWFGLPLASQLGWCGVSAVMCGILSIVTRRDHGATVPTVWKNPLFLPALVFVVQVAHVSVVAIAVGAHTLGASGLLIWIPVVAVLAATWSQQTRPPPSDPLDRDVASPATDRDGHDDHDQPALAARR